MIYKNKKIVTVISEGMKLKGRLYSPYPTKIQGSVVGEIISNGGITISKYSEVKGNIKTKNAVIGGKFTGNLIAAGKVEITSTGMFFGNIFIKDADFIIQTGGVFKGKRISVENEEIFEINKDEIIADINIKIKK